MHVLPPRTTCGAACTSKSGLPVRRQWGQPQPRVWIPWGLRLVSRVRRRSSRPWLICSSCCTRCCSCPPATLRLGACKRSTESGQKPAAALLAHGLLVNGCLELFQENQQQCKPAEAKHAARQLYWTQKSIATTIPSRHQTTTSDLQLRLCAGHKALLAGGADCGTGLAWTTECCSHTAAHQGRHGSVGWSVGVHLEDLSLGAGHGASWCGTIHLPSPPK